MPARPTRRDAWRLMIDGLHRHRFYLHVQPPRLAELDRVDLGGETPIERLAAELVRLDEPLRRVIINRLGLPVIELAGKAIPVAGVGPGAVPVMPAPEVVGRLLDVGECAERSSLAVFLGTPLELIVIGPVSDLLRSARNRGQVIVDATPSRAPLAQRLIGTAARSWVRGLAEPEPQARMSELRHVEALVFDLVSAGVWRRMLHVSPGSWGLHEPLLRRRANGRLLELRGRWLRTEAHLGLNVDDLVASYGLAAGRYRKFLNGSGPGQSD